MRCIHHFEHYDHEFRCENQSAPGSAYCAECWEKYHKDAPWREEWGEKPK